MNKLFEKMPFRKMAEKIPAGTREKIPVLNKAIPFANHIVCGLVAVLLVVGIISCGGANSPNDFSYEMSKDGKGIVIKGYTGKPGKVVVPSKIEGIPVVEIGKEAFDGKTYTLNLNSSKTGFESEKNKNALITSITIPNTITKIGEYAFANTAIIKFKIPEGVKIIDDNAFYKCEILTTVTLPTSIEYIGQMAFNSCKNLHTINLPDRVMIGLVAFGACENLSNLTLPNTPIEDMFVSVISRYNIDSREFGGKYIKTLIEDPSNKNDDLVMVSRPDNRAFAGCKKLPIATRQKLKDMGYGSDF